MYERHTDIRVYVDFTNNHDVFETDTELTHGHPIQGPLGLLQKCDPKDLLCGGLQQCLPRPLVKQPLKIRKTIRTLARKSADVFSPWRVKARICVRSGA